MQNSITFVLPGLLENRYQYLVSNTGSRGQATFSFFLSKSCKKSFKNVQQWLVDYYNLPENYKNAAYLMAKAQGLVVDTQERDFWLRADPVMLTVGHNGLFCRGNRTLQIDGHERDSLQTLINNHFQKQGLEIILTETGQGYLKSAVKPKSIFTPLDEVMGSEISLRLPTGEDAAFWHGILTDLQMLLHNCEVNRKRQSRGLPVISGFWLWAESDSVAEAEYMNELDHKLYTDELTLSGLMGSEVNLPELGGHFNDLPVGEKPIHIYVSEFQQLCSQNDEQGWLKHYNYWLDDWLIPAIEAVNKKQCKAIKLITDDGYSYHYNSLSRWCFWR